MLFNYCDAIQALPVDNLWNFKSYSTFSSEIFKFSVPFSLSFSYLLFFPAFQCFYPVFPENTQLALDTEYWLLNSPKVPWKT